MRFDQKTVLVTGGTSGIGLAVAKQFAAEGAHVVITGRTLQKGQTVVQTLAGEYPSIEFITCDVKSSQQCSQLVDQITDNHSSIDVLVNNAGIMLNKSILNTSEEEWDTVLDTSLKGCFLMSKAVIPVMKKQGGGSIINVSSIFGLVGGNETAAYCAAKGGIVLLTKAMAVELAPFNIRVNCVCPGSVDTPLLRDEIDTFGDQAVVRQQFAARHPLNRISTPEEQAEVIAFLASAASSFITGAAIPVDGGRSAW